jgi:hypothetical protein
MAFKAGNVIPSDAYQTVKRAAVQLKVNVVAAQAQLAASGADYQFLQGIYLTLTRANDQFNTLRTTPGLADYAQAQENDPAYDVAAEFAVMQAAITAATDWMDANIPTSVTAKVPSEWDGGVIISNTFTPAQTVGLQTALQGVADAIT